MEAAAGQPQAAPQLLTLMAQLLPSSDRPRCTPKSDQTELKCIRACQLLEASLRCSAMFEHARRWPGWQPAASLAPGTQQALLLGASNAQLGGLFPADCSLEAADLGSLAAAEAAFGRILRHAGVSTPADVIDHVPPMHCMAWLLTAMW